MSTARPRPRTDAYLAAVAAAVSKPGRWQVVDVPFATEANARVTAHCLEGGYLRVQPRDSEPSVVVAARVCLRTPAPVETRVTRDGEDWRLAVRYVERG